LPQNGAYAQRGRRWHAWLLPLALAALMASCSSQRALVLGPQSPVGDLSFGVRTVGHPVGELDLEAMLPPGGAALMSAPLSGTGPVPQGYGSLGRLAGKGGTITVAFVCDGVNSSGFPILGWAVWHGPGGAQTSVTCNPTPDRVGGCAGGVCVGQNVNLMRLPNGPGAFLPAFKINPVASWSLFAWLDPKVQPETAGVTRARRGLSHFMGYGMALDYPAAWRSLAPPYSFWGLDHPTASLYLSTVPLREPCKITVEKNGSTRRGPCHTPISSLPPGGVFITWTNTGTGGDQMSGQPGRKTFLAGQPARVVSARPVASASYGAGTCESLHAGWLVAAAISLGPDSIDRMIACVRAGRASRQVGQVMAMLHSLSLPDVLRLAG